MVGCGAPPLAPPSPAPSLAAPRAATEPHGEPDAALVPLAEPALVFQGLPGAFDKLALDPRGELLAIASGEDIVVLRHADRSVVARIAGGVGAIAGLTFGAAGRTLLAWSGAGQARLWDVVADSLVVDLDLGVGAPIRWSAPDDQPWSLMVGDRGAVVLDLRTGEVSLRRTVAEGAATAKLHGSELTVEVEGRLQVYDLAQKRRRGSVDLDGCLDHRALPGGAAVLLNDCPGHEARLVDLASGRVRWARPRVASLGPKHLAVGGGRVVGISQGDLLDLTSGATLARGVMAVAVSADGSRVLYVHRMGQAVLDAGGTHPLGSVGGVVSHLGFDGDVAEVHASGGLFRWDARTRAQTQHLAGTSSPIVAARGVGSRYGWVQCEAGEGSSCHSIRWVQSRGEEPAWDLERSPQTRAELVEDSRALLLGCSDEDLQLLGADGTVVPIELPDGAVPVGFRMSPDQRRLALDTPRGILLWDRASGAVTPVPQPPARPDSMPPTLRFHPRGIGYLTFEPTHPIPQEGSAPSAAFWYDGRGHQPVRLTPRHTWSSVTWHPAEPIVFLNSGWGSAMMMSWWAGDEVSAFRLDGTSLGTLDGHSVSFSPKGELLLLAQNHPSRGDELAETVIMDAKTRRRLGTVPGFVETWATDGSWFVTREESPMDSNAPGGPSTFTLYVTATRVKQGSVVTSGHVSIDGRTAELTATEEVAHGGAYALALTRWDLRTGARVGAPEHLAPDDPRGRPRGAGPIEIEPRDGAIRLVHAAKRTWVDLHTLHAAKAGETRCRWVLVGPDGRVAGDLVGAFKARNARDLRRAPLESGDALAASKLDAGLYPRLVGDAP